MAKRGAKPQSDEQKVVKGTFRRDRTHAPAVPELEGEARPPKWLKGQALSLWLEKVDIYTQRGQKVRGCEAALAQYCAIEADLIGRWKRKGDIPVALLNAHRIYANEFYDTPASQQVRAGGSGKQPSNPFARNGRRLDLRQA